MEFLIVFGFGVFAFYMVFTERGLFRYLEVLNFQQRRNRDSFESYFEARVQWRYRLIRKTSEPFRIWRGLGDMHWSTEDGTHVGSIMNYHLKKAERAHEISKMVNV